MSATKELVNLSADMDMLAEMKEWRGMEKRLAFIKEEFGYDTNAWNYVRNAFGDKGSLGSAKKLEINRDIAKIARIRTHSSASQGHMDRGPGAMLQAAPIYQQGAGKNSMSTWWGGPVSQNPYEPGMGRSFRNSPKTRACFECGSPTHIKRDCPFAARPWADGTQNFQGQRDDRGRGRG
jgi:hypothetical protein